MIFPNLCIFSLLVFPIINPLISDDGDFVCCRVISEIQHALEKRLPSCGDTVFVKVTRPHGYDESNALDS